MSRGKRRLAFGLTGIVAGLAIWLMLAFVASHPGASESPQFVTVGSRLLDFHFGDRLRTYRASGQSSGTYNLPKGYRSYRMQLSYSRDGRWVVVSGYSEDLDVRSRLIQVFRADDFTQSIATLPRVGIVSWSPDGKTIVADMHMEDQEATAIVLIDMACIIEGSNCDLEATRIAFGRGPTWSPDGSRIAYISDEGKLTVLDVASGSTSEVHRRPVRECLEVDWSPSGRYIAYRCVDGSRVFDTEITRDFAVPDEYVYIYEMDWLPDQDLLLFSTAIQGDGLVGALLIGNEAGQASAVYSFDPTTKLITRLTTSQTDFIDSFAVWPGTTQ